MNVPPGQPDLLAQALSDLAGDPARLQGWGQWGRRYVERFERDTVQEKFVSGLGSLLEQRGP
jgi:glycosyltransferase involved in cell wall biosynthesis